MSNVPQTQVCNQNFCHFSLCFANRRKKCDETFPVCSSCSSRNKVCVWPESKTRTKPPAAMAPLNSETSDTTEVLDSSEKSAATAFANLAAALPNVAATLPNLAATHPNVVHPNMARPNVAASLILPVSLSLLDSVVTPGAADLSAVEDELKIFKEDLTNFQLELDDHKNTELLDEQLVALRKEFLISPPVSSYYSIYSSNLDAEGLRYLDIYRERYCVFISIGLDSLNYFLKTFMALATHNESILYAVTAWGGFYHELGQVKGDFSKPWLYMQKAAKLMCQQVGDHLRPTNSNDLFVLFAFYLIFIGIEVCTGDVRNWGGFLSQCSQLIQSCGGLEKVSEMFHRSNDIKWLISDFQFHDVLSSEALLKGTKFSIEEYKVVLPEDSGYGIDPLQGTVGPIYHLLGEIGNAKVELRRKWAQVENEMNARGPLANEMRRQYYEEVEATVEKFNERLTAAKPWKSHIGLLEQNPQEFEVQMSLFELYVCVCRMQLATSISQIPPSSAQQQHLLMKALELVDLLLPTKVKVALSLLLLMCGITCVFQDDRDEMIQRFRKHLNQYEIGNFQRIEELVEEAWARNPDGNKCVDWAELGYERGWNLYVG